MESRQQRAVASRPRNVTERLVMRLAIGSDIHGNLRALEAVLADPEELSG
jgi:hypothetical protein